MCGHVCAICMQKTAQDVIVSLVCSWPSPTYLIPANRSQRKTPWKLKQRISVLKKNWGGRDVASLCILQCNAKFYGYQNIIEIEIVKFKGAENNGIYSILTIKIPFQRKKYLHDCFVMTNTYVVAHLHITWPSPPEWHNFIGIDKI